MTSTVTSEKPIVVLVAGLFSPRITMLPLAWRLKRKGYATRIALNRSVFKSPPENAERLFKLLQGMPNKTIHLVGHSLGGVVILNALKMNESVSASKRFGSGKVVLIGSPVGGSAVAKRLHAKPWLGWILGRSVRDGLLQVAPNAYDGREFGVISGSTSVGVTALFYRPEEINDGLVTLAETVVVDAKDSICIPQSHAMLLFSKKSAELTAHFLSTSRFS